MPVEHWVLVPTRVKRYLRFKFSLRYARKTSVVAAGLEVKKHTGQNFILYLTMQTGFLHQDSGSSEPYFVPTKVSCEQPGNLSRTETNIIKKNAPQVGFLRVGWVC